MRNGQNMHSPKILRVAVMLGAFAVGVLLAEVIVRTIAAADRLETRIYEQASSSRDIEFGMSTAIHFDEQLLVRLRPGLQIHRVGSKLEPGKFFQFSTDAAGYRISSGCESNRGGGGGGFFGRGVSPPPGAVGAGGGGAAGGVGQMLALGDSCTFGFGVADDESWPAQLNRLLIADPGLDLCCTNAAVPGYTSYQGLEALRRTLERESPAFVVASFAFNDMNPLLGVSDRRLSEELAVPSWVRHLDASGLVRYLRVLRIGMKVRGLTERIEDQSAPRVPLEEYAGNFRAMAALCREHGAALIPVIWPMRGQDAPESLEPGERQLLERYETYQAAARHAARELGLPLIDLAPDFQGPSETDPFVDLIHASAYGNGIVAERVIDAIRRQQSEATAADGVDTLAEAS
ncbi:MAG: hypothetical protein GC168_01695 [Candidatus Hydrogenedens sp.]|nr:hypothetical protein [Candidatus Hydrogenedens sp.]